MNEEDEVKQFGQPGREIRSLRDLVDTALGKNVSLSQSLKDTTDVSAGEVLPFPFGAIVGQKEMKLALLLSLINPSLGGVILLGPRGTGKTTAVRSLLPLLPMVERSACVFGCLPEDIETGGMDAVCPECAKKYAEGVSLTRKDLVRMVEIPLNATIDDVVGGLDDRIAGADRFKIKKGLLAQADQNLLYIDEVNLLPDNITDAILDASAQGRYTLRRGMASASYRARFNLIGSMNPEEGRLRPQIMDRFGLRVIVQRLETVEERKEAYQRVHAYNDNPVKLTMDYISETGFIQQEILTARDRCKKTVLPEDISSYGIALIQSIKVDSLRADITLFEAARAHAAADNRSEVLKTDIDAIAPMALRLRRSRFMDDYFAQQRSEEDEISAAIEKLN
jgi:magnesium chelatase subunit I